MTNDLWSPADVLTQAFEFASVQRPPQLQQPFCTPTALIELVTRMLDTFEADPSTLTLNLSNITVPDSAASAHMPAGDFVGVTISGTHSGLDTWWNPTTPSAPWIAMHEALLASAAAAYARTIEATTSITVLLR